MITLGSAFSAFADHGRSRFDFDDDFRRGRQGLEKKFVLSVQDYYRGHNEYELSSELKYENRLNLQQYKISKIVVKGYSMRGHGKVSLYKNGKFLGMEVLGAQSHMGRRSGMRRVVFTPRTMNARGIKLVFQGRFEIAKIVVFAVKKQGQQQQREQKIYLQSCRVKTSRRYGKEYTIYYKSKTSGAAKINLRQDLMECFPRLENAEFGRVRLKAKSKFGGGKAVFQREQYRVYEADNGYYPNSGSEGDFTSILMYANGDRNMKISLKGNIKVRKVSVKVRSFGRNPW